MAEKEQKMGVAEGAPSGESDVIVGYALTEKKCRSLFSPELINEARAKGVHFLPIDPSRPIEDQVRPSDAEKSDATPPPRSRGHRVWNPRIRARTREAPRSLVSRARDLHRPR